MQENLTVTQESHYIGEGTWDWAVWLEGPDDELDKIDHVVYTLHRSFPNPVRTVSDRRSKFRLESNGWGSFRIYVEVVYGDGTRSPLEYDLKLFYPEEAAAKSPITLPNVTLIRRITSLTPKRLLAIDAAGVRSLISIEILAGIENRLRARLNRPDLVLADYFDYVAGTSTGAILAAFVSLGITMSRIRELFLHNLQGMFARASLLKQYYRHKYDATHLSYWLKEVIGQNTTLGSEKLQTLLLIVVQNMSADAGWFLSNNPSAKYNDRSQSWSELQLPLWQIVKASSAAPTYFPPEVLRIDGTETVFVDGTLTGFGNPAFQLFLRATAPPYQVRWPVGENKLLLVSIGSGSAPDANPDLTPDEMNILYNASAIPSTLMGATRQEQDFLCRMFGRCLNGHNINRELGDMIGLDGPVQPKLFTYLRYDAELTHEGLTALGLREIEPRNVHNLDSVDYIMDLQRIGRAIVERELKDEHYSGFDV